MISAPQERMRQLRSAAQESPVILPSLLQCDFGDLKGEIAKLESANVRGLHLDVMDGVFVPNLTYGMPIVSGLRRHTDLPLDVHLMIAEPSKYIAQFVDAGADCLTIHAEIEEDHLEVLQQIREHQVGVGLAVNPTTPLAKIEAALPLCDLLLVMSVEAGFGGQTFNPVALDKLKTLKESQPDLLLEVDGGVNVATIESCHSAGASLLVVGSAIFGKNDYLAAMTQLREAMEGL